MTQGSVWMTSSTGRKYNIVWFAGGLMITLHLLNGAEGGGGGSTSRVDTVFLRLLISKRKKSLWPGQLMIITDSFWVWRTLWSTAALQLVRRLRNSVSLSFGAIFVFSVYIYCHSNTNIVSALEKSPLWFCCIFCSCTMSKLLCSRLSAYLLISGMIQLIRFMDYVSADVWKSKSINVWHCLRLHMRYIQFHSLKKKKKS